MSTSMPQGPLTTAQVLAILHEASDKTYKTGSQSQLAGDRAVMGAKSQQAQTQKSEAHGTMMDSVTKVASSAVGLGLNYKTSIIGNTPRDIRKMKDEADAAFAARSTDNAAHRAGLNSVAQQGLVAQMTDKVHDAASQTIGGQAEVNAAKVAGKEADVAEAIAKTAQDQGKTARDQAAKGQDTINDFAKGIIERAKQATDRIFG